MNLGLFIFVELGLMALVNNLIMPIIGAKLQAFS